MSELKIIDTLKSVLNRLKSDPGLIALFVLPAMFPIERIITNLLSYYLALSIVQDSAEVPSLPPIPFVIVYVTIGFLLEVWASAAAIIKISELEKGSRLGLKEALFRGLKKVAKLLAPAIVGFALFVSMIATLTLAFIPQILTGMSPPAQDVQPSVIVIRVGMGFLFAIGLYVATRLRLAAPACVLENSFGITTSWKLVKGNWWKVLAIFLVLGGVSALISRIPTIGIFISSIIMEPLVVIAATLIYFRLREAKTSPEEGMVTP